MNEDRYARIWAQVVQHSDGRPVALADVCATAVTVVAVDGVGVTVRVNATLREIMHATDGIATALEELQLTLGEGPCVDCFHDGSPAHATDLRSAEYLSRWPMFTPAALEREVRAVFALPLQVGAIRLGIMDLYRTRPGGLSGSQWADALTFADAAALLLLDMAEAMGSDPGGVSWRDGRVLDDAVIHQATGMVLVQLGVDAEAAFVRLRGHAYVTGRRLGDVARDVVERRIRFTRDPPTGSGHGGGQ
jgi:hypothetical protein